MLLVLDAPHPDDPQVSLQIVDAITSYSSCQGEKLGILLDTLTRTELGAGRTRRVFATSGLSSSQLEDFLHKRHAQVSADIVDFLTFRPTVCPLAKRT